MRPRVDDEARFLLIGGGADPASTPVSLAQDLKALSDALEGPRVLLFASGEQAHVALEREAPPGQDVHAVLARLFSPPGHASLDYRPARLSTHGPAHHRAVRTTLARLSRARETPLLIYFAGHGEQGEQPSDNRVLLWGGGSLSVRELAETLETAPARREVRLVNTACFGGGFADFVFQGAQPEAGLSREPRCGTFAAPWDDEASGCDPNPDRRTQESYSLHLVQALTGAAAATDLDGDGQVGLLDAHTHARVSSRSFDIPVTTSERFLRLRVDATAADPVPLQQVARWLPEDWHVVKTLGEPLGLLSETAAWRRVQTLEDEMQALEAGIMRAQALADERYFDLRIALLERWPLLEHPWRPPAQALVQAQSEAILDVASASSSARAYAEAVDDLEQSSAQYDRLRVERARVLRVAQAYETLRLAHRLRQQGGAELTRFEALRACERRPL